MTVARAFSIRGAELLERMRALFDLAEDLRKTQPAEYAELMAACAAHVRSAAPMAMAAETIPLVAKPESSVRVALGERSFYEIERDGDKVRLYVVENTEHDAAVALNDLQVTRLRHDLASVASSPKEASMAPP